MSRFLELIIELYVPIFGAMAIGFGIGVLISRSWVQQRYPSLKTKLPSKLGQFLFWIGIPISIINFLHRADLSGTVLIAPVIAWVATLVAFACSWFWLQPYFSELEKPSQGSFFLTSMFGNTSYIGFPVTLLLPQLGPQYFGWALFYDLLGTLLGVYGLGVFLALRFSSSSQDDKNTVWSTLRKAILKNPTVYAFIIGLLLRNIDFPPLLASGLNKFAWFVIMSALVLIGIRLQQLSIWRQMKLVTMAISVRMFLVPMVIGMGLTAIGVVGPPRLVMVLQAGMPCAFGTIVVSENYGLSRELTVPVVGVSSIMLLLTLPLWLWGFCTW